MNFEFDPSQEMLRDQARRFLKARDAQGDCRRALETGVAADGLWRAIAEQGWQATVIPERYGGLGLAYLDLCVIAEELGRSLAPVPFSSSVYVVTELLIHHGSASQKASWLPRLADGSVIGALAAGEGPGAFHPARVACEVSQDHLTGVKTAVVDGARATLLVVAARNPSNRGRGDELSLYLVDATGPGVEREDLPSLDESRRSARYRFDRAPAKLLGAEGVGMAGLSSTLDRAAVLVAFEQLGGAERALEMACEYARERKAFGREIGSFQAIKHKLADLWVLCELARANAYHGAWALSNDAGELPVAAACARIAACQAFEASASENMQVHGGMGFTWEADCHLFYRRAKLLSIALGAPLLWRDRLISTLLRRGAH